MQHARLLATGGWLLLPVWAALALGHEGIGGLPLWWLAQAGCVLLGAAALAVAGFSHRVEPNPYALVMRRLAGAASAALVLVTAAVALGTRMPTTAANLAAKFMINDPAQQITQFVSGLLVNY